MKKDLTADLQAALERLEANQHSFVYLGAREYGEAQNLITRMKALLAPESAPELISAANAIADEIERIRTCQQEHAAKVEASRAEQIAAQAAHREALALRRAEQAERAKQAARPSTSH